MRKMARWVLAGTFALGGLAGTAFAHGNDHGEKAEKSVTMDQLPSAVRSTFQRESQNGRVEGLEMETHNGKTLYEGEVVKNGQRTELHVDQSGTIVKREGEGGAE